MFEYDEENAVKFIQDYLPQDLKERFTEDDLYYILDVICEFYEKKDWMDDEDEEKEEEELIQFIVNQSINDKMGNFTKDEIRFILIAEAAYSDTLGISE
jgi:hypothetical protein